MNNLPSALQDAVELALGIKIETAHAVEGGEICQAGQLQTADGTVFLKWRDDAPPGFFEREAQGLSALRAAGTLRVPDVLAQSEASEEAPAFLALEWIDEGIVFDKKGFAQKFAAGLAALHGTASADGMFGFENDNYLGVLPQINTWTAAWPTFLRDCRFLPQIEIARQRGHLTPERERLSMALVERLEELLGGFEPRPVLLHGDLWSGNYRVGGGGAVLVDPAVYYGEREMEMAYIQLFGGFPADFFASYQEALPLQEGYERRRALYQLYHLLVHLNHFGEPYGTDVERVCRSYVKA